ncbi:TonB-dependent receptor [Ketobacter sp. MCCC 1A13808]|uniref:TonB-dependent receptor domain-containing protein n=1 Tax=Ketobacter sp. MCCC 1A13808 TaxID=2602738 RepID=UPI0012EB7FC4|nr:TonB-dependent receptor [Ketobacter sp. MCCC 1A13808]MVF12389.1 TonB-dependent receptor [Ketobacter sp. MCCC 1A13808]
MKFRPVFIAGSTLLPVAAAVAQENMQLAEAFVPGLGDEIVVTASRSAQTVKETLASTSVINREQIERSQARNVYQILKTTPGVYVRRNGGRGNQTTVSLRGMPTGGTLILMDGIRLESGTSGTTNLQQINVDQIDRIEIVRGSKSSLYGSSALGGVIQIFSRKGEKDGITVSVGAGSDNTRDTMISASGSTQSAVYNATVSYSESDGYDVQYGDDTQTGPNTYPFDDDSYSKGDFSFSGSSDLTDNAEIFVTLNRSENSGEFDGGIKPYTDSDASIATIGGQYRFEKITTKLQYGRYKEDALSDDSTDPRNTFNYGELHSVLDQTIWENVFQINDKTKINFGAEYTVSDAEYILGFGRYDADDHDQFSGYLNARTELGGFVLEAGVRHDDDDQFGSELTGDAGIGYWINEQLRISATAGNAFKAPSNNDLYFPGYGDPTLLPEESKTAELGLDFYRDDSVASLHLFQTKADNLIAYNPAIYGPENIAESKVTGVEFQWGTVLYGVNTGISMTYQRPIDEVSKEDLALIPSKFASLDLDKDIGKGSFGLSWYVQSKQLDNAGEDIAGYGTLALRAGYQLTPEVKLRARIDNVLDKDYIEITDYNTEGLFAMFFVDYTPN